jgi:hypothetical protein
MGKSMFPMEVSSSWTFEVMESFIDSSLALTAFVALHCILASMNNQDTILLSDDSSLAILRQHNKQIPVIE